MKISHCVMFYKQSIILCGFCEYLLTKMALPFDFEDANNMSVLLFCYKTGFAIERN